MGGHVMQVIHESKEKDTRRAILALLQQRDARISESYLGMRERCPAELDTTVDIADSDPLIVTAERIKLDGHYLSGNTLLSDAEAPDHSFA